MTNYYFPIIYIVPLTSVDGQASPRLFIAPEIRHEKTSCTETMNLCLLKLSISACISGRFGRFLRTKMTPVRPKITLVTSIDFLN